MVKYKESFNTTHPELREGEVFLTNISNGLHHFVRFETARIGIQAYTESGEPIKDESNSTLHPVFVALSDWQQNAHRGGAECMLYPPSTQPSLYDVKRVLAEQGGA